MSSAGYREKCLEVKGNSCKICGSSSNIEVHHIDGNKANNKLENLIPLCGLHHRQVHSGTIDHPLADEVTSRNLGGSSDGENKKVTTIRLDWRTVTYLDERSEQEGKSRSQVIRDILKGEQSSASAQSIEPDRKSMDDARVEDLKEEIEFLRSIIREALQDR